MTCSSKRCPSTVSAASTKSVADVPRPFARSGHWSLSDAVSLREESFGALAYHHGTRRLVFVKSPVLVDVLRRLGDYDTVDDALGALVEPAERDRFASALASLARSEILSGR